MWVEEVAFGDDAAAAKRLSGVLVSPGLVQVNDRFPSQPSFPSAGAGGP